MQCYVHCRTHRYKNVRGINIPYRRTSEMLPIYVFLGLFYHPSPLWNKRNVAYIRVSRLILPSLPPCKLNIHVSSQIVKIFVFCVVTRRDFVGGYRRFIETSS
jgi:hypothetical protein